MMRWGPAVLFVSASHSRAIAKAPSIDADGLIYDLEDAVAPAAKVEAREALREALDPVRGHARPSVSFAVRVNGLGTPHFAEDMLAARAVVPDAIVLPKVERPDDVAVAELVLDETDAPSSIALAAIIETPRSVQNAAAIADRGGRLEVLIAGTNDLVAATGVDVSGGREPLHPWLAAIVLAARAGDIAALDGVPNGWHNPAIVEDEAREAARWGFDGKTLVHPAQIEPTRIGIAPSEAALAEARAIAEAFKGVDEAVGIVTLEGRMFERLHLEAARRTLARVRRTKEDETR